LLDLLYLILNLISRHELLTIFEWILNPPQDNDINVKCQKTYRRRTSKGTQIYILGKVTRDDEAMTKHPFGRK